MKTLLELYMILYNWFQLNISFFKKYMRIQLRFLTYSFEMQSYFQNIPIYHAFSTKIKSKEIM